MDVGFVIVGNLLNLFEANVGSEILGFSNFAAIFLGTCLNQGKIIPREPGEIKGAFNYNSSRKHFIFSRSTLGGTLLNPSWH